MHTAPTPWTESESLELHARLLALGARVAAAESLTAGGVQAELARRSGASAYFVGGLTAYELAAKTRLLGVDAAHAVEVNAVSERVAAEMARGAARLFRAQVGVATTGYAEPDAARGVAEPFAWVAVVWGGEGPVAEQVRGEGLGREEMQAHATATALRLLTRLVRDRAGCV